MAAQRRNGRLGGRFRRLVVATAAVCAARCAWAAAEAPGGAFVPFGRREVAQLAAPLALLAAGAVAPPVLPGVAATPEGEQVAAALEAVKELKVNPCWEKDDTKCGPIIKTALGTMGDGSSPIYKVVKGGILGAIDIKGMPKISDVEFHFNDLDKQADYWIAGPQAPGPYWDQAGVNARAALGQLNDDLEDANDAINGAG